MKLRVFIPRDLVLDTRKMKRAIENTLSASAKAVKVDLDVTTQTWTHRSGFTIDVEPGRRIIATDDEVYGFVDEGTKPHIIQARNAPFLVFGVGGSAKTRPRVIASRAGSKGTTIVRTKIVHHPGTEAREFTTVIQEKWDRELPTQLQRSIDAEV